jgi:hypothetical protein
MNQQTHDGTVLTQPAHSTTATASDLPLSPLLQREAREAANRWLVQFTPLLDDPQALNAAACRQRIGQADALRASGERVLKDLEDYPGPEDAELLTTLREAVQQLDGLQEALKLRLGVLAPGDPASTVDPVALRARLEAVAARQEVQSWAGPKSSLSLDRLELETYRGSFLAGLFPGIFAFGWLSFTTVHACFMIGGAVRTFGLGGLLLLGFYSIFWAVGIGMAWAAVRAASTETVTLEDCTLTLRRSHPLFKSVKSFTLGPKSRVYFATPNVRQEGSTAQELAILDATGREVRLANGCPHIQQKELLAQINDYLGGVAG